MKRILATLAVIIPLQTAQTASAQVPPPHMQPMRAISVTGEASDEIAPDQAVLSVSVVSRNQELGAAKQHNDALTEKVLAVTKEFSIPQKNVATSNLYISPDYNYENNRQRLVGYVVNRSLRITMDKLDIHEQVLSKIIAAGVDQVGGVEFKLSNPEDYSKKLRGEAIANARARAEELAKAAGVTVGKPLSIAEGGASAIMPPMPMMAKAMEMSASGGGDSAAPSLPGMIHLNQSVSVVYEIE